MNARTALASLAGLGGFALVSSAQVSPQSAQVPAQSTVTLTVEEQQRMRAALDEWAVYERQMTTKTPPDRLHDLLDRALSGDQVPDAFKPAFVALFAPSGEAVRQFLDAQYGMLRQKLQIGSGSIAQRSEMRSAPLGQGSAGGGHYVPVARRLTVGASTPARSPFGVFTWLVQAEASAGQGSMSQSGDLGGGRKGTIDVQLWWDTDKTVAQGEGGDISVGASDAAAAGNLGAGVFEAARVDRCPSADGIVEGNGEFRGGSLISVRTSSGVSGSRGSEDVQHFVAEGHNGDDAMLKEVRIDWNRTLTLHHDSAMSSYYAAGTAVWYPHGSDNPPPRVTACSASDGPPTDSGMCNLLADSLVLTDLRQAYLRAEKQWNFSLVDAYGNRGKSSKCVTVEFKPKSKSVRGKPGQSVAVEAQIQTVDGRRPTWGTFDELMPIGGDIQQDGARTAPGGPAKLTYKAPEQPWAPNNPPGFDVVEAKSRAGAFKGVFDNHSTEEEYQWLLKPGLKLTIHDRWEGQTPLGTLLSEATFPIELTMDANGNLSGQAMVARTHHQQETAVIASCTDTGHWTETWQAAAVFDDSGENLTIKLRYRSSDKEGVAVCPPAPPKSYRDPGGSSDDVQTPLSSFTMPAQEGSTRQFVFGFGAVTKTVIDVTVAPAEETAR